MKIRYLAQLAILTVALPLSAAQTQEAPQASPASLVCNRVRFLPAPGNERAMIGGKFAGSNVSRRDGFQTLAEIKTAPPAGQWGELTFDNTKVAYCGVISVQPGIHVKAVAYKSGMADSEVSVWSRTTTVAANPIPTHADVAYGPFPDQQIDVCDQRHAAHVHPKRVGTDQARRSQDHAGK